MNKKILIIISAVVAIALMIGIVLCITFNTGDDNITTKSDVVTDVSTGSITESVTSKATLPEVTVDTKISFSEDKDTFEYFDTDEFEQEEAENSKTTTNEQITENENSNSSSYSVSDANDSLIKNTEKATQKPESASDTENNTKETVEDGEWLPGMRD